MKGALRAKIMADVIAPLLKRDALESLVVDGFEDVEPFLVALALLLRLANRSVLIWKPPFFFEKSTTDI